MRGGQRFVGLPGDEFGKLRDEIGEAEDAGPLEAPRLFDQLVQVGQLPLAEEFGQQHGVVAGQIERSVDQLGQGQAVFGRPQRGKRGRGKLGLLPLRAVQFHGQWVAEQARRQSYVLRKPQQRFVQQAEHRAAKHAAQAYLVAWAVDRPQQIQQVVNFLLGVEGVSTDEVIVDAVAAQGLFVVFHVRQGAEQQGHVARPHRPHAGAAAAAFSSQTIFSPLVEHGPDSPGDPVGLAAAEPLVARA